MSNEPLIVDLDLPRPQHDPRHLLARRPLLLQSPAHPDDYILHIDHSSLENFNNCARRAEYSLVQRRQPVRNTSALSFGTAIHKALETSLRVDAIDRNSELVTSKQSSDILEHFSSNPVPMDEWRTADRALDIMARYRKQFEHDVFDVLEINDRPMVEVPFALPLGTVEIDDEVDYAANIVLGKEVADTIKEYDKTFYCRTIHVLWTGRIDAIIVMDGKIWVMDHKTTSMGGDTFLKQFQLSAQTVGYTWAAQELLEQLPFKDWQMHYEKLRGPDNIDTTPVVSGLLLNGIISRKPSRTGTAVEFLRQRFLYDSYMLDEWKHNTLTLVSDFLTHLQRGFFPMQTTWCIGKYGVCPYFDVCNLPPQQRPVLLNSNLYEDITWSPLNERA